MPKQFKAAFAAVVAALLLLGGMGSLAYWTDLVSVPGDTGIDSGTMKLTDATPGTCAAAGWTLDSAESPAGGPFVPATDFLVPGDVITKTCTFTVAAKGTHLHASLAPTNPAASGTLAAALVVGGTFEDGGSAVTDVTEAMDGDTVTATITVTFDPTSGNTTQLKVADVSNYTVALTQTHA